MREQSRARKRNQLTIIGLGNELLSDDGVGIRIVRQLKERLPAANANFEELSVGGLPLLDYITGYERCVIIDAVVTGKHPAGTVYRCVLTAGTEPFTLASSHQIDLSQVVTLAALMGGEIPRTIVVYGIEAADTTTFHDGCTEEVSRAVPTIVETISRDIEEGYGADCTQPAEWQILHDAIPA